MPRRIGCGAAFFAAIPRRRAGGVRSLRGMLLPLVGALLLTSCVGAPHKNPLSDDWLPSPNYGPRSVSLVVLHHTSSGEAALALATLRDPVQAVSAHYLISRAGRVIQLVDERDRAWHAGRSRWGAITDVNGASIGIELDNNGAQPFAVQQMTALYTLLDDLRTRYHLTPLAFVGHADVAPGRKVDPSALFPWRELAQRGFGLWCDPPLPAAPAGFDVLLGLQALGYDLGSPDAAADAFALHYGAAQGGAALSHAAAQGSGAVSSNGATQENGAAQQADAPQAGVAALDAALVACVVQRARSVPMP